MLTELGMGNTICASRLGIKHLSDGRIMALWLEARAPQRNLGIHQH
jgi:hypothetical protein